MSEETRLVFGAVLVLIGATIGVYGLLGVAFRARGAMGLAALGLGILVGGGLVLAAGEGGPV